MFATLSAGIFSSASEQQWPSIHAECGRRRPHSGINDAQCSYHQSRLLDRSWNRDLVEPRDVFAHQFGAHSGGQIA